MLDEEELESIALESTHTIDIDRFVRRDEVDEIYVDAPYYLVPNDEVGAEAFAVKGGRFVFWAMDLNPDEALAAGWLRRDSWTTKRLMAMLEFSLRRATTIVALDRFMAKRIADNRHG